MNPVAAAPPYPISVDWRRWIVENSMQGLDSERIVSVLISNGFPEDVAREAIQQFDDAAINFQVGKWNTQRLKKLESVLTVQRAMASLSNSDGKVSRKTKLSREEFLELHYAASKPVILVDVMRNWRAVQCWTPEYLKTKCGDVIVEVMTGREIDQHYEVNMEKHKTAMMFGDYINLVYSGKVTNDSYMTGNNHFLKNPKVQCLLNDIEVCRDYFNPEIPEFSFFWFGPGGTVTQPHHDELNIMMSQVSGTKQITLVSPDQTHLLYNDVGVYSDVDWAAPDYERYPLFSKVKAIEVTLSPGEMLFIPVGWWHHVKALEPSITISLSNFVFPNDFRYMDPEIRY